MANLNKMKNYKLLIFFGVMLLVSSCAGEDTASTKTEETSASVTRQKDSSRKTSVSVGSGGVDVRSEKADVKVDGSGVNVGTKDVKVDVRK